MDSGTGPQNAVSVSRFWRKYQNLLEKHSIPTNARPWYRRHVEAFLSAADKRLAQQSAADVDRYLDAIGGEASVADWRFRQIADALRILFCELVQARWSRTYDWKRWLELSVRLSPGHPTTARDTDANLDVWTRPEAGSSSSAAPRAADTPLLGKLIAAVRKRGYSIKTEQTYLHWTARFLKFHGDGSPDSLSGQDVAAFLEYLAVRRKVSASTQNIALNALAFFFERALERPLGDLGGFIRARGARRLPVVLSREEVRSLLARMGGQSWLMAALLYGTGMRLMECVRLRVLDVDFAYAQITVRQGKGGKDRVVPLPEPAVPQLREHLDRVQAIFERDRAAGFGEVYIPEALARKYPNAPKEWGWRWVFPASRRSPDPLSNASRRHHIHETVLQKAIRTAAKDAGISKRVTTHTLRHAFATHLLEDGYDIRTIQELLGHADVATTMIYTHVLNRGGRGVRSPLATLS